MKTLKKFINKVTGKHDYKIDIYVDTDLVDIELNDMITRGNKVIVTKL